MRFETHLGVYGVRCSNGTTDPLTSATLIIEYTLNASIESKDFTIFLVPIGANRVVDYKNWVDGQNSVGTLLNEEDQKHLVEILYNFLNDQILQPFTNRTGAGFGLRLMKINNDSSEMFDVTICRDYLIFSLIT